MSSPPSSDPAAINVAALHRVRPVVAAAVLAVAVVTALVAGIALQRIDLAGLWQKLQTGGLPQAEPLPALLCQPQGGELVCTGSEPSLAGLPEALTGLTLRLSQPLFALKPFTLALEGVAGLDSAVADFTMPGMYMGVNRYALKPDGDAAAAWRAEVTLPVCTAARTDWLLTVLLEQGGKVWQTEVALQVEASLHRFSGG